MNCALYIGCGTDFDPVSILINVRKFIFIDSKPLTSDGSDAYRSMFPSEKRELYCKNYMRNFMCAALEAGFQKISIDGVYPHVYKNHNTHQEIYHYFNLCFPIQSIKMNHAGNPDEMERLILLLNEVSHLVVRGYSPDCSVLKYFVKPVVFIGFDDTIYSENLDDVLPSEQNKITVLLQQNAFRNRISSYIFINKTGQTEVCSTYEDFIDKTKAKV
jgi:hypothetical protein